jgi:origin recognition complex subunit 1
LKGTGKTASVKSIVYNFNQEQAEGKIPSFQFVSVNGMEMRHPFDVYVRLWEAVSNRKAICPAEEALANLELCFGGNPNKKSDDTVETRKVVVVMVDEIDYLVTKKQTVLYNLFDWPSRGYSAKSPSQLIVIGISNTLNLPERLHMRLQSRIGRERCMYASYSIGESLNILKGKLGIAGTNEVSIFFYTDVHLVGAYDGL